MHYLRYLSGHLKSPGAPEAKVHVCMYMRCSSAPLYGIDLHRALLLPHFASGGNPKLIMGGSFKLASEALASCSNSQPTTVSAD